MSAQSVAVGNLGTLAMRQGDEQTAMACLEQHLQLVQQLGDYQGEIFAWAKMAKATTLEMDGSEDNGGGMNTRGGGKGRHQNGAAERSLKCFERAAALAKAHGEVHTLSCFGA